MPTGIRMMQGNDLEKAKIPADSTEVTFADFLGKPDTTPPNAMYIAGAKAPNRLTMLQQIYCGEGCAPLEDQLEDAWLLEDEERVRDILELQTRQLGNLAL